jgi:hypothetical protein
MVAIEPSPEIGKNPLLFFQYFGLTLRWEKKMDPFGLKNRWKFPKNG